MTPSMCRIRRKTSLHQSTSGGCDIHAALARRGDEADYRTAGSGKSLLIRP